MSYQYKSPLEFGYKQFKLTKKQHNDIFKRRKMKWIHKYEYYYKENAIRADQFYSWKVIVVETILYPILLLLNGLVNAREFNKDFVKLYKQKKSGYFVSEHVSKDSKLYEQLIKIIKANEN